MLYEKLLQIKEDVLREAAVIENILEKTVEAIYKKNTDYLNKVINDLEPDIDRTEIFIEEKCITLIALYQPEAKDLRTILMILKMNRDLERIGDLIENIAESGIYLAENCKNVNFKKVPDMAKITISMLKDSVDSFRNEDNTLATIVCRKDDEVDNMLADMFKEYLKEMYQDPKVIEESMNLIRIAHNLERIADNSTNIAEETVYMSTGKKINHQREF